MDVRVYVDGDYDGVVGLWEACGLAHRNNDSGEMIRRKVAFQRELFLVGVVDGRVVATVMGGYEGRRGWINLMGVHPDFQRRGYATDIMVEAERRLGELGCPKVNLQVRASNSGVVAFYQAMGYEVEEVVSMGKRL